MTIEIPTGAESVDLKTSTACGTPSGEGAANNHPRFKVPVGAERRRRRRAKMDVGVHVRGGMGTLAPFEDVGRTIDVSRDGLLLATTARDAYQQGKILEVTFPFSGTPEAIYMPQKARIVRTQILAGGKLGLGIELNPMGLSHTFIAASTSAMQVKVLVVESDPRMAEALKELLSQDGYQAILVRTPALALAVLHTETPDVILTEVEGDEICGHDLCAIVKTNERLRHVPVILTTHTALASDYAVGNQLGAVICIPKPCPAKTLFNAIRLVAPPPSARSSYSSRVNTNGILRTS